MLMGGGEFFSNLHHFSTGENGKKSRFSQLKNSKLSLVLLCRMLHHIIYICCFSPLLSGHTETVE